MARNILDTDGIIYKKKELQIKTLENFILAARKQLRINLKKILKNLSLS